MPKNDTAGNSGNLACDDKPSASDFTTPETMKRRTHAQRKNGKLDPTKLKQTRDSA